MEQVNCTHVYYGIGNMHVKVQALRQMALLKQTIELIWNGESPDDQKASSGTTIELQHNLSVDKGPNSWAFPACVLIKLRCVWWPKPCMYKLCWIAIIY